MNGRQRAVAGVIGLAVAVLLVWGGIGFFGGSHYDTTVKVVAAPPTPPPPTSAPPTQTVSPPSLPCPNGEPGPVHYFADDPQAARYKDFGTPLVGSLSPLYEPPSTPQPDTRTIVRESWSRLCQDPALTRAVVAAAYPTWSGLATKFDWQAALKLLAQVDWSSATMSYYGTVAPTPWTMMMVASTTGGAPQTFIVHAPFQGWYLSVRFGGHVVLLRPGCGDQPVLDQNGYQAPLFTLFPRA